ncbi:MAG: hypothetical protein ACLFR1_02880 [Spirochaetia bacterium]
MKNYKQYVIITAVTDPGTTTVIVMKELSMHKPLYKVLFAITVLATLGGLLTLIPWPAASWPNIMGYSSLCTFAPAATLYCFLIAGISCFLRAAFVKESKGTAIEKLQKHLHAVVPLAVILVLALGSTVWFVNVKVQYTDAGSAATEWVE